MNFDGDTFVDASVGPTSYDDSGADGTFDNRTKDLSTSFDGTIPGDNSPLGVIDRYELVEELGGGGFGVVYRAYDTIGGEYVAVKGLPPAIKHSKEELENIRKNFLLFSRLHHPHIADAKILHKANVVRYEKADVKDKLRVSAGDYLAVMEFAPGLTLSQWRQKFANGKVPISQALIILQQIAEGLDYAHSCNIIHRDIKPSNIMVETRKDGSLNVRILDFGLAAEVQSSLSRVSKEITDKAGTYRYMAPEQWSGKSQGYETDQYALAVLANELFTGKVPFESVFDKGDKVIMRETVIHESPEIDSTLPFKIRYALKKALAKNRKKRFNTCCDFVNALRNFSILKTVGIAAGIALIAGLCGLCLSQQVQLNKVEGDDGKNGEKTVITVDTVSSKSKAGDTKTINLPGGATMEMVWCPPCPEGFMMGSPTDEDGRFSWETQHKVILTKGFWMGKYEVTQAQWESVMGNNPSRSNKGDNYPVECVSWDECQEFCEKVGQDARLPTEAEWEYACRAGTTTAYYWGNSCNGTQVNCNGNYPCGTTQKGPYLRGTTTVGSYKPNAWGLYDMSGNVWEWTQDLWDGGSAYPAGDAVDPVGTTGSFRVRRGGGWYSGARYCRSAYRSRFEPGYRSFDLGVRLVCSAGLHDY